MTLKRKPGRNDPCFCGSGKKFKKCCLSRSRGIATPHPRGFKIEKSFDAGTDNKFISRLSIGLGELFEFSDFSKDLKRQTFEILHSISKELVLAERIFDPINQEVISLLKSLNDTGIPIEKNGIPTIPVKCTRLHTTNDFFEHAETILLSFFKLINLILGTHIPHSNPAQLYGFALTKFGEDHTLTKLLKDDHIWISELEEYIVQSKMPAFIDSLSDFRASYDPEKDLVTIIPPSFSNGKDIVDTLKPTIHNLFTFVEEISAFILAEHLDRRLCIYDIPEASRSEYYPGRFRVGVRPQTDIESLKDDPTLSKIYRLGGRLFHMREKIREESYGSLRPIIHCEFQGMMHVAAYNRMYRGKWKTFVDFLLDYIKMTFGKEWWSKQAGLPIENRSPVLIWAEKAYLFQKSHSNQPQPDGCYESEPNGPMFTYLSLAYDLFVLEDNHLLQKSLINRMKQSDITNFWGARYEAKVAAILIKSGFNISYEDERDGTNKHPEFIATYRKTGEQIAVEAKKRNRTVVPPNEKEIRLGIVGLLKSAVSKFNNIPLVVFLELDLPPIHGNLFQKPWFKELLESHEKAGVRDVDGKDLCNMIVFTNDPVEDPTEPNKYPAHSDVETISMVPKASTTSSEPLYRIMSFVRKRALIPNWFDE